MASRARSRDADLPHGPVSIATGTAELVAAPERPALVTLMVNGVPSSCLDLEHAEHLEFEYHQQMAAVIDGLPPGPLAAVHLGAGACSLPRWLDAVRPGSRQLAVDVDAVLVERVRQWFDLPRSPRLRLRAADAREALTTLRDQSADVVVRDVFAGDTTPADLVTREVANEVRRVLRPSGLYLVNCADRPPLTTARAEVATLAAELGAVLVVAEPAVLRGRRYANVVLVAGGGTSMIDLAGLGRRLRALAVPARLLDPDEAADFSRSARPLTDAGVRRGGAPGGGGPPGGGG
ncbi:fused MFS/spermidine synthase, partial [Actinotalea sp. M2MS4P-6]|uniref:spermidine synthase n=1 Tax=Actinotalea sp. M2MS4P-6 TaxID=2983762 RepID=UPI0021E48CC2